MTGSNAWLTHARSGHYLTDAAVRYLDASKR
jgi:hypothetical protein